MGQRRLTFLVLLLLVIAGLVVSGDLPQAREAAQGLRVDFFDVGQGDAILLTTPDQRQILIDGGPDSTILTRLGEAMPFWDHTLDLVVASHNHADHITGLNRVLERYEVGELWLSGAVHTTQEYRRLLELIRAKRIPTTIIWRGKPDGDGPPFDQDIGSLNLQALHPLAKAEGEQPADQHDATIVLRATFGDQDFLFTGDINEDHEKAMLGTGDSLESEVLKIPHHGSASGLAPAFLRPVNPAYAIIQVGAENRFGHPAPSIIQKLQDKGVETFRTDQNSTVTAITDGHSLSVKTQRK